MDACVPDEMLVRLVAGELSPAQEKAARDHLAACQPCHRRRQELQATWALLGQARLDPPPNDLTARILSEATRQTNRSTRWSPALGVAAAVLLAAGLGIAAGLLVEPSIPRTVNQEPSEAQVAESLGLDALDTGTALFATVFESEEILDDNQKEQPS